MATNKKARGSSRHGGNKDKQAAGARKSAPRRGSARVGNDISAREDAKGGTQRGGTGNRSDGVGRVRGVRAEQRRGSPKLSGRRGAKNNSSQRSSRVNKQSAPQQKGGSRRTGGGRTGTDRHAARR